MDKAKEHKKQDQEVDKSNDKNKEVPEEVE